MVKFRKWNSPAFNEGELWVSSSGVKVRITSVSKHPAAKSNHSSSYEVTYYVDAEKCDKTYSKDCWSFQVRYSHISDLYITKEN